MSVSLRMLLSVAMLAAACTMLPAHAQQSPSTNRATEMRQYPEDSSSLIRTLPDKTAVQVMDRRGAWSRVRAGSETGWVRMIHLRGGTVVESESTSGGGFFAAFNRLLGGDRSSGRAQSATVGVRGFSREDVERANFNPAEFDKLKRFQVTESDAQRFASQGRLAFRRIAYLSQDAVQNVNSAAASR
jgi:hypothetical protein